LGITVLELGVWAAKSRIDAHDLPVGGDGDTQDVLGHAAPDSDLATAESSSDRANRSSKVV
jgi:hypothetical protein